MGVIVGWEGGGSGVSVRTGLREAGKVEVTRIAVAVGTICWFEPVAQLLKSRTKRMRKINFDFTD
jgi:hypothetical protein